MGITKNKKTDEFIITMARETFPDREIPKVQELTEGMCNAAYMLTFEDGFQTVLKIASANNDGFMTNESNPYIFMSEDTAKSVDFTISPLNVFLRVTSKYKDECDTNGRIAEYIGHKIFINNDLEYGEIEIR